MYRRTVFFIILFLIIAPLSATTGSDIAFPVSNPNSSSFSDETLALIELTGTINQINLPIYAHLVGKNDNDYVLVKASTICLETSSLPYTILDPDTHNATYAIVSPSSNKTVQKIAGVATILFDDGKNVILKTDRSATDTLLEAGLHIKWLRSMPMVIRDTTVSMMEEEPPIEYDPRIDAMVGQVSRDFLNDTVGSLSGERPVTIGGENYTILTRNTESGEPINKVTQFGYDSFSQQNLAVSFYNFTVYNTPARNVIGTQYGTVHPDEIVIVSAHIDSFSNSGNAPGADDDGSGVAGVLACANIMKQYHFERTIRFVLFSGEEEGLYGSDAYAADAFKSSENIIGVLNLDMTAWNSDNKPIATIHTRSRKDPTGYTTDMRIAETFNRSVDLYDIRPNMIPSIISDGDEYSDHASFWNYGYPAVNAIEDDSNDFNPYYHSENDRLHHLNMEYFTNYTKTAIATTAHLAKPVDPTAPVIMNITPATAPNTATVMITNLSGTNFQAGAIVSLNRSGSANISGTDVVVNATTITCKLPVTGVKTGLWDVMVKNPDGRFALLVHGFTVTGQDPPDYVITATTSDGGSITPAGQVIITSGGSQTFTITPSTGYQINSVLVNNTTVGTVSTYTFSNVITNHTIHARFTPIPPPPGFYQIIASTDNGGIIEPEGVITVLQNASQTFVMRGRPGYEISSVHVDGAGVGQNNTYTFSSVQANHTISLISRAIPGVVVLLPITPTPEGIGYSYYNQYGTDPNYRIYAPGTYILAEGFTTRNSSSAIKIMSANVTLDGNGQKIVYSGNKNSNGILSAGSNITVRNFKAIEGFYSAIISYGGDDLTFEDNIISNNSYSGLSMFDSSNITIARNSINNNYRGILLTGTNVSLRENNISDSFSGIELSDEIPGLSVIGNRINNSTTSIYLYNWFGGQGTGSLYNNYLASTTNIGGNGNASFYSWTNPAGPQQARNVVGGPYIAGNYWSNLNGTGWSDQQPVNANGYTTIPYAVAPGANDTAPLVKKLILAPTITSITPSSAPNTTYVNITNLAGKYFQSGAGINLTHSGYQNITAMCVIVNSSSKIICTLPITGAAAGTWNVTVTNPDGQLGIFTNGFTITGPNPTPTIIPTPTGNYSVMINSSANDWSIIVPKGNITYPAHSDQSFITQAKPGAALTDVQVDTASEGGVSGWTFTDLNTDHTIHAVANPLPNQVHVFFNATPRNGEMPLTVNFYDQSVGNASSWFWQFGDGTVNATQNPKHTYQSPGIYPVTLRATNGQTGGYGQWNKCITVASGPVPVLTPTPIPGEIVSQFSASPTRGTAPLSVQFNDESTGSPTSWIWDFGDGTISTLQNPMHQYTLSGTYTVTLLAHNRNYAGSLTLNDKIVVQ